MEGRQVSTRLKAADETETNKKPLPIVSHTPTSKSIITSNRTVLGPIRRNGEFLEQINVRIDAMTQKLKEVSGKRLTQIMHVFLMISIFACPLLAVSSHPIHLNASSPLIIVSEDTNGKSGCLRDEHCVIGSFCHDLTKSCVPCLTDECLKWKRHPGTASCAKSQDQCGNCLSGYKENHGHCQPVPAMAPTREGAGPSSANSRIGLDQGNDSEFTPWKSPDTSWLIISGVVLFCFLGTSSPLLVYFFRVRKRRISLTSIRDQRKESDTVAFAPEDDFGQPPPYNPLYGDPALSPMLTSASHQSHHLPQASRLTTNSHLEVPIEREMATTAVAFSPGLFPTVPSPASSEEEAQVTMSLQDPNINEAGQEGVVESPEEIEIGGNQDGDNEGVEPDAEEVPVMNAPENPPGGFLLDGFLEIAVHVGFNLNLLQPPVHPSPHPQSRFLSQTYVDLGVVRNDEFAQPQSSPHFDIPQEEFRLSEVGEEEEPLDTDVSFYD